MTFIPGSICSFKSSEAAKRSLKTFGFDSKCPNNYLCRSEWQYDVVLRAVKNYLDITQPTQQSIYGLAFGVGNDHLPLYFASKGIHILASDLSSKEWPATDLTEYKKYPVEILSYREMDMNHIHEDCCQHTFDFCWSLCSLDHLGSIKHGQEFIYNSLKCLKPGGIAVHTGEFCISHRDRTLEAPDLSLWLGKHIQECIDHVKSLGYYSEFDWSHNLEKEDTQAGNVYVQVGEFITTSFSIIVQAPEKLKY